MEFLKYPPTRTDNTVDSAAGLDFPDPYRWLECDTEEVQQWQAAQNQLAQDYVQSWPHYERLKERVSEYLTGRLMLPRQAGEYWFRLGALEGKQGVIMATTPYGQGRLIYDTDREHLTPTVTYPWFSPSPDACLLALGVCTDGSENNRMRLIDVGTGECLTNPPPSQTLMDGWLGGAQWLPDSRGFYFQALVGDPASFRQQMLFHSISDGTQSVVELPQQDPEGHEYVLITMSPDGRFRLAYQGLLESRPIALLDTQQSDLGWQQFITEACSVIGHVVGNQLIAVTNHAASRGRVVSIPLEVGARSDTQCWTELIPESEAVINAITLVDKHFYLSELIDTYSRVRIFDEHCQLVGEVPLPARGSIDEGLFPVMKLASIRYMDEYLFSYSTLFQSWGVYSHRPYQEHVEMIKEPQITLDNAVVDDYWAVSDDGTRIPYHCLRLATTDSSIPQPTLIYAYGGYNSARPPAYPGAAAAFVAAGGIYVLANLRGGGELGKDWWRAGRMKNKQTGYKDLYAVAEDLIDNQRTSPKLLAVNGASNGGLMSTVALLQRPDLW